MEPYPSSSQSFTWETIFEASPTPVLLVSDKGQLLQTNSAFLHTFGYTKEEVNTLTLEDLFPEYATNFLKNPKSPSLIKGRAKSGKSIQLKWAYRISETDPSLGLIFLEPDLKNKMSSRGKDIRDIKIKALLEAIPDAIFIQDLQGNYTDFYPSSKQSGWAGEESLIGKNMKEIYPPEVLKVFDKAFKKLLSNHKPQLFSFRLKTDKPAFYEARMVPMNNHQVLTIIRNVTSKIKEAQLKDESRRILENITLNTDLKITGQKITAALQHQLAGVSVMISLKDEEKDKLQPLAGQKVSKSLLAFINTVEISNTSSCGCGRAAFLKKEVLIKDITKDENGKLLANYDTKDPIKACWSFPILSSSEEVLGTIVIYKPKAALPDKKERQAIRDMVQLAGLAIEHHITLENLKESEEQLKNYTKTLESRVQKRTREVEATVQKLIETNRSLENQIINTEQAESRAAASQVLFSAIAKNFPKGVIMVFNPEQELIYLEGEELNRIGFHKKDFEGKTLSRITSFRKDQKHELRKVIVRTLRGDHLSFDLEYLTDTYAVNTTPLYVNEEVTWALLVFSNITEQKRIEAELVSALKIEQELNELKSRFISMASHEFRTPLSAILSSAILIGRQNEADKKEKREKYVNQIKNNVRNLVVILNDFLSLSKLEEGKISIQPENFNLIPMIQKLIEELENNLKKGQKIQFIHTPDTLFVYQDPKLLRHILINLCSNAIKYSDKNRPITIRLFMLDGHFTVEVIDEGMGIPKEEQNQLFDRFFRAHNAANLPGTGLGLHIVKQYTELLGGTVWFESEENIGSSFFVKLPVHFKEKQDEKSVDYRRQ